METIQQIGDRAEALILSSWKNAQATRPHSNNNITSHETNRWKKPSVRRFKCNVNASFSTPLNKVGFGACIRDADGNFVASRTALLSPSLDVAMGKALGLLHAMQWVIELNLVNMDFGTYSKVVAYSIYKGDGVFDFMTIIHDSRHLLMTELTNSDVKFIRRQSNGVAHSLAKDALCHASFPISS